MSGIDGLTEMREILQLPELAEDRCREVVPLLAPTGKRNAHGQSLDDAREAFRSEWQAKVERKRRQAAWATLMAVNFQRAAGLTAVGTIALSVHRLYSEAIHPYDLPAMMELVLIGAILGVGLALPLAAVVGLCAWPFRRWARRLEREARKMERH